MLRTFLALALALPHAALAAVKVEHHTGDLYKVTFSFSPQIGIGGVAVAGSFNDWRKDQHPLADPDGGGTYQLTLELPQGRYLYKFVVDGKVWQPDPDNTERVPDGFDSFNSVVTAGDAASSPAAAARPGDGEVVRDSILHRQTIEYCEWVAGESLAVIRLRAAENDVENAALWIDGETALPLKRIYTKNAHDYWEAVYRTSRRRFTYVFLLRDGAGHFFVGPQGIGPEQPAEPYIFDREKAPQLDAPNWVADAVFYQIFPERFFDGDPANNPQDVRPWSDAPGLSNHFGGDLEGVRRKLPYLNELGVSAIYFNPVFAAPSNHKYDTADYRRIDPHFGDAGTFRRLAREARRAGIRTILDGVFNHSGDQFAPFLDAVKNGKSSRYADWYTFRGFPVTQEPPNYECWWNFPHLPKLNTDTPKVAEYLLEVSGHWLKEGAAGWRLDVPNEVPHRFWKRFRGAVRRADPEAYIVGEIWNDALPWLQGDEFDAVMNYTFRSAVLGYFAQHKLDLDTFHRLLLEQRHRYPRSSLPVQFNLLGSHDTARIGTLFTGANAQARLKLAVLFQLTYLGAPVIYYGDEVGLKGGKDPDCRRTFPWEPERQDLELLAHYKKLIGIRRALPELRRGEFHVLAIDRERDIYVFLRTFGADTALVALHRGDGEVELVLQLPEPLAETDRLKDFYGDQLFTVEDGRLKLKLAPYQGMILAPY
ncbi:MAG: alpha amylase N-terminal ig-like domain-containing protein [Elusimicrobiota bacterium]